MRQIWNITGEDYLEIIRRAKADGVKAGESIEKYLFEYMKEKGQKPCGHTELNNEELLNEMKSKGNNILEIKTDENGKQNFNIHEKNEEE